MTFIAGMAVGAALISVIYDIYPWLKQWWNYLGEVEEIQ